MIDLIVLAGGRGVRLGGRDKAALVVGGRTLLERVLDAAPGLGGTAVVVGATSEPVPAGTLSTVEDPPDGGPVAGIEAGLNALDLEPGATRAPWVAVVAVDQPRAAAALAQLREHVDLVPGQVDALAHLHPEGAVQWLLGIYRRDRLRWALHSLPRTRDIAVRQLVADLRWLLIATDGEDLGDVDTPADLAHWQHRTP
ncbi:molybdenum cofactor guanylyltransferase [Ornithinimicrobium sp. Y1694]|uniref:molybdenum cofactor guanylyltransferase n=1 Tax=Ornithinimicrobium sp. Y1694 TaxID=3418590 RepID=UPI003CF73FFA